MGEVSFAIGENYSIVVNEMPRWHWTTGNDICGQRLEPIETSSADAKAILLFMEGCGTYLWTSPVRRYGCGGPGARFAI